MILIGTREGKRTDYMRKAAAAENTPLEVLPWEALQNQPPWEKLPEDLLPGQSPMERLQGAAVKIDPPPAQTFNLEEMAKSLEAYKNILEHLAKAECRFLNTPESIRLLLDKRRTKHLLGDSGIPVTEMFPEEPGNVEELLELMERRRCYSVFVKPRYFSGAAGVAAFRVHPKRDKFCLYTSCQLIKNQLANTKKLLRTENPKEICHLLDRLLALDCVVERWHPKANFHGKSFDLRVVFQFGHVAFIVARQSPGPITNLHLNNQALPAKSLGLASPILDEIETICAQACSVFPGLSMAGIDILLERGTLRPRIIEMNGQGDLIYQDIYGENLIYREQARHLRWEEITSVNDGKRRSPSSQHRKKKRSISKDIS